MCLYIILIYFEILIYLFFFYFQKKIKHLINCLEIKNSNSSRLFMHTTHFALIFIGTGIGRTGTNSWL